MDYYFEDAGGLKLQGIIWLGPHPLEGTREAQQQPWSEEQSPVLGGGAPVSSSPLRRAALRWEVRSTSVLCPYGCHCFCDLHWLVGKLTLPCFRGQRGWTHSKFIVWILLSFPEWPGISELLHFIGSVVAGERHGHRAVAGLLEWAVLGQISIEPWATSYTAWVLATKRPPNCLHREGWRRCTIWFYCSFFLFINPFHSSPPKKVYVFIIHVCDFICVFLIPIVAILLAF